MSFAIDLHSHWFPPGVTSLLRARHQGVRIETDEQDRNWLRRGAHDALPERFALGPQWFNIDLRIDHLARQGIVHQLLSWPTTLGLDPLLEPASALPLWSSFNDEVAELVATHPRLFSGLATLSTADIAWSVKELRRARRQLGLLGAVLPVNVLASQQAARQVAPIFAEAQEQGAHIYLHTGYGHGSISGQPVAHRADDLPAIRAALDTAHHFASAVLTLLFSDFLDVYPDVTVQVAMLGGSGTFALVLEQILAAPQRYGEVDIEARLQRIWFDTGAAGSGPQSIVAVASLLGAQRILFGTDYAPAADTSRVLDNIRHSSLSEAAKRAILHDNAHELLTRKGVRLDSTFSRSL